MLAVLVTVGVAVLYSLLPRVLQMRMPRERRALQAARSVERRLLNAGKDAGLKACFFVPAVPTGLRLKFGQTPPR